MMALDVVPRSIVLRGYCGLMLLIGAWSGYGLWTTSSEASAYEAAEESAKQALGGADASANEGPRPTQAGTLCVGILRYVETQRRDASRRAKGFDRAVERVREMASVMGLTVGQLQADGASDGGPARGYGEEALSGTFEKTDLEHFAAFLYNAEVMSTSLRTLELKWALLPESANNDPRFSLGHRIDRPRVRIGQRFPRPIGSR